MSAFFIVSKRKGLELLLLLIINIFFYIVWGEWDLIILYSLGFIWNWAASQEEYLSFDNRRYRFSTLKTVINLQKLILRPVATLPRLIKLVARTLPAGLFWLAVILFNESAAPWWAVFLGSLTLEIVQLETKLFLPKDTSL